jgi:hypothetical protein
MKNYNDFCKEKECGEYIEWDFVFDAECQPYPCTSCQKVGQSYDIEAYPEDCVYIDEIKKIKLDG